MTSGGSPRAAGALLAASVLATTFVRGLAWWYSGFTIGPVLGGLTAPLISVLPGRADETVPIVELFEVVVAIIVAVLTIRAAGKLFREELPAERRLTRQTRLLLELSVLHLVRHGRGQADLSG
jgi:hypothetical protein